MGTECAAALARPVSQVNPQFTVMCATAVRQKGGKVGLGRPQDTRRRRSPSRLGAIQRPAVGWASGVRGGTRGAGPTPSKTKRPEASPICDHRPRLSLDPVNGVPCFCWHIWVWLECGSRQAHPAQGHFAMAWWSSPSSSTSVPREGSSCGFVPRYCSLI
jgi:hypothetical protein